MSIGEDKERDVLRYIRKHPGCRQMEIRDALELDTKTIRQILRRLRRKQKATKIVTEVKSLKPNQKVRNYHTPTEQLVKDRKTALKKGDRLI